MIGIVIALIYIYIVFICYKITYNKKDKLIHLNTKKIIIISVLFTALNILNTYFNPSLHGDKYNYYIEFKGIRNTSIGLSFVFNLIKNVNGNFQIACYFTTFICTVILLIALKLNDELKKESFLFLLLTDIIFFTFTALKQCYTIMLTSLFFGVFFSKKIKGKKIICTILIIICCLFHSTGFILIPIYIIMLFYNRKKIKMLPVIFLTLLLLFFHQSILLYFANLLENILPNLSNKINEYFFENSSYIASNTSFIKGAPFYFITLVGTINYKKYKNSNNYDKYLILSIIGSVLYLMSIFSYWMFRFTALFYYPISMIFSIIAEKQHTQKNKTLFEIVTYYLELIILIRWIVLMYINYGGF